MKKIIIAIDGPSASGKSTLAKDLSEMLSYIYVDSGAMYRAVTLYLQQQKIPLDNIEAIRQVLGQIRITFQRDTKGNRTLLNGIDVEDAIRSMEVSRQVSQVAAIPDVRTAMVQQQRAMGVQRGIVMDGRDIGTVVFPDAELKLFIVSDVIERARRRYAEIQKKQLAVSFEDILHNLHERDRIDSTRAVAPLRKAQDAFEIDNTQLSPAQQLARALELVNIITSEQESS
ncbi:MAG TPA: (d)CMP kinase [Saprospiraceae bacterium]|nr:(d)CMP kinase [Saprospiraceae bacterium]HMP14955.1 (d)CMP kinase [Saprospiraceae bacterium]